jgi:hypothetical protein
MTSVIPNTAACCIAVSLRRPQESGAEMASMSALCRSVRGERQLC